MDKKVIFSGSSAHHQNVDAERSIKTIVHWWRSMLLCTAINCHEKFPTYLLNLIIQSIYVIQFVIWDQAFAFRLCLSISCARLLPLVKTSFLELSFFCFGPLQKNGN